MVRGPLGARGPGVALGGLWPGHAVRRGAARLTAPRRRAPRARAAPAADDPFWWSDGELALLRGTRLAAAVALYRGGLDQLAAWLARLEELRGQLAAGRGDGRGRAAGPGPLAGRGASLEAARWARSAVWSRAFAVRGVVTGGGAAGDGVAAAAQRQAQVGGPGAPPRPPAVVCLVPLLDMADHHPNQRVGWHTGPQGGGDFKFVTLKPIPKVGCGGQRPWRFGAGAVRSATARAVLPLLAVTACACGSASSAAPASRCGANPTT